MKNAAEVIWENRQWLFSGIGVLALSTLAVITKAILNYANLWKRNSRLYEGVYETYMCRIRNDGSFIKSGMQIRRSLLGNLKASLIMVRYEYTGEAELRGHNVFFRMKGLNRAGYLYCIFKQPLGDFDILQGVYAGITSRRLPVCGKIVMRKTGTSSLQSVRPVFLRSDEMDSRITRLLEGKFQNLIQVEDLLVNVLSELTEKSNR